MPLARPAVGLLRPARAAPLESVRRGCCCCRITSVSQVDCLRLWTSEVQTLRPGVTDGGRKLQGRVHFGRVVCPEPDPPAFLLEGAHDSTGPSFTSGRIVAGPGVRPQASLG